MQDKEDIFSFSDPIDFLNYKLELKKNKNPKFSLRSWSMQLGYKNPSLLSQILSRKRAINSELSHKLIDNLHLSGISKKYFEVLILYKKSKTIDEQKIYLDVLESLKPRTTRFVKSMDIEIFKIISEWYHIVILELLDLKDFQNNPLWIRKALKYQVSTSEIESAIKRLVSLQLVERTKSGKLIRKQNTPIILDNKISSIAIQSFHKQMIEKAKSALELQEFHERDFRGSTICIKTSDYNRVLEIIKKAHSEVVKYATSEKGDDVYHLNTQFFRLTKKERSL